MNGKIEKNIFSTKEKSATYEENAIKQIIDCFPSILGYWKNDLNNLHLNNAYAEYFEQCPDEIRGKHIQDLMDQRMLDLHLPFINGALTGKTQTFECEITLPSGAVRSTLTNYTPHTVNGVVVGFFVNLTDISEKRHLEEKTLKLETSLYEQSRFSSLGQMASGIAHEINNPLAIIYGFSCLLLKEFNKKKPNSKYVLERLKEIESTALRIVKIIDGLRSISAGKQQTSLGENDITEIISQVVSICRSRFINNGLKIIWLLPEKKCLAICSNIQISEILLNLLNNAFDAIKNVAQGEVRIEIQSANDLVEIKVFNNGPPINSSIRKMIFLPFFTTKGTNGTGLGLKISQDLARANGGELRLSDGDQTEFVLSLRASKHPFVPS